MAVKELKQTESTQFKDDVYVHLEDEFSQIQQCVGMYISQGNNAGALHLFKEIFNNALDECVNRNSPSDKIYVTFNEEKCEFTVADEGRGIPLNILKDTLTKKHTSTKFSRDASWTKGQAGRNGVGMTVTAALSDYMSVTSYRNTEYKTIEFIDCKIQESGIIKLKKGDTHGLAVKLIPSEKYLGEIDLTIDMVEDYLRHISYLLPTDIKVIFYGIKNDETKPIKRTYTYQGLIANVEYLSNTLEFSPVEITYECDEFDLLMAFSYDKSLDEMLITSYCNYIHTTEGGTHEIAAQRAICDYICREAKRLDPNNKFEIVYDDCKKGLIIAVNCKHIDPAFEGQHKSKVSNKDVLQEGKRGLNDSLYKYFNMNNALLRKIINYLRQISKIRMEANKIKGISTKKPSTFLDDADLKGFVNIADRSYNGYTELIITEGDSALGAILNTRNSKHQAVFAVRGVTDNVHGLTPVQLLQKEIFRNLIKVLGCGVGKDFDMNKLKWNKIIIMSDADIDGSNITSLILCFFLLFMRPIVDDGKLFKALPPLYIIDKKNIKKFYNGNEWVFDKNELYGIFNNIIASNINVGLLLPIENNKKQEILPLTKSELKLWLKQNSEYLLELANLSKRSAADPYIAEYICYYKLLSMNDEFKFKELIENKFKECHYDIDTNSLYGSHNCNSVSIIADSLFMKMAKRYISLLAQSPTLEVSYENKNDKEIKGTECTIGQFLNDMNKSFNIKIEQRLKGLGESEADALFVTTINPKMRKLIKFTIDDLQDTLDIFELLHGKSSGMREKRRDLLEKTEISYADIDS